MKASYLFPTVLWEDKLNLLSQDVDRLVNFHDEFRTSIKGKQHYNNCYQSPDFNVHDHPVLEPLGRGIYNSLNKISSELFSNVDLEITNMWFNSQMEGEFNKVHSHGLGVLSGVYYLKAPEGSGRIFFERNLYEGALINAAWHVCDASFPPAVTRYEIKPVSDLLLLFPSWLPHGVEKSRSIEPRISIAFNVSYSS